MQLKYVDILSYYSNKTIDIKKIKCYLADRHLVGGEGSSLIRANDRGTSKGLYRGQTSDNGILLSHAAGS